jgi:glycogen operon protein
VEGPAPDHPEITALRKRQMRNFLTTLFCSHGVPLLLAGDEFARTQGGNNNAYCQDNAVSWIDWRLAEQNAAQLDFVRDLMALRKELGVLRLKAWSRDNDDEAPGSAVHWFSVWGLHMTQPEWENPQVRCVAALFESEAEPHAVLLLLNSTPEEALFTLPHEEPARRWIARVDTRSATVPPDDETLMSGEHFNLIPHSMAVLTATQQEHT